jgi:SAM-dependent methyltransferase
MRTAKRERAARWLTGSGIEIGALHNPLPVPEGVTVRYVDRVTEAELRAHYPELDGQQFAPVTLIGDAEDLSALGDSSVDFVIANHLIEHLENPIKGIAEMCRVLRPGGVLYIALPDPRVTFDRDRPLTSIEHVVAEYQEGAETTRRAHYEEWVDKVVPLTSGRAVEPESKPSMVDELLEQRYSIHFHVWRAESFLAVLVEAMRLTGAELEPLEFIACDSAADDEYILVLRKGMLATPPALPPLPSEVEQAGLRAEVARLSAERDGILAGLASSPSRRLTRPLRVVASAARQLRRR